MSNLILNNRDILIASDHRGFELKKLIIDKLRKNNKNILDLGPYILDVNDDYSDFCHKVAELISKDNKYKMCGILICGSGNGMSICANRFKNVRAIVAYNDFVVTIGRKHNDSNILIIPADLIDFTKSISLIEAWLLTLFSNEERHIRRLKKIDMNI